MTRPPPIDELRRRLAEGEVEEVRRALARRATVGPGEGESHVELGELCEEAGLFELARVEYEAALATDPDDRRALRLLADLCEARGDRDRLLRYLSAAAERRPGDGEVLVRLVPELQARSLTRHLARVLARAEEAGADPDLLAGLRGPASPSEEEGIALLPHDADLVRFLQLFGGREDMHARQWFDRARGVGFTPVPQPLTVHLLRNHVLGNVTLGVYPIRLDGTVGFFALDIDLERKVLEHHRSDGEALVRFRETLRRETLAWIRFLTDLGLPPLVEDSGYKGRHLWVHLAEPLDAARIRFLGQRLLAARPEPEFPVSVEFFPKQGRRRGKGLGNLIKLPLGIHRRTGRRAVFLGPEGEVVREPWEHLRNLEPVTPETVDDALARLDALAPAPRAPEAPSDEEKEPDVRLGPLPILRPPRWTEGDFEVDPEVRHLLACCPVLAALKEKVDRGEALDYDEQVVLRHTLGHLPQGVLAFNYLLGRLPDVRPEMPLKSTLRGSPSSCARIRQRLPRLAGEVSCSCSFSFAPGSYPTPLLHLRTLPESPPKDPDPREKTERLARAYAALCRRGESLGGEREALERELCRRLENAPDRRLVLEEGVYRLVDREGVTELLWEPAAEEKPEERPEGEPEGAA